MSEKRSWDIQPKQKAAPIPRPAPRASSAPKAAPARKQAPRPAPIQAPRREKVPQGRQREPLKDRRRRARRRTSITLLTLFILIVIGVFVLLWLPMFRIQHADAAGPDSDGIQIAVMTVLAGSEYYVFPRDSIFLFPETAIRSRILQQYPDISAVAISRASFNSIAIASVPREQSFVWCGTTYTPKQLVNQQAASSTQPASAIPSSCYSVDGQGVLFAPVAGDTASSSGSLIAYAPLAPASADGSLLGSSLTRSNVIPNTLAFIKVLRSLNAAIVLFVIRDDEVDLYTQGGTRITYVLGREDMAKQLAESAFSSLSLNDSSLEYVDLRFDGKVYFKKVGGSAQASAR